MHEVVLQSVEHLSDWIGNLLHGNREVEGEFIDKFFGMKAGDYAEIIGFKFNGSSFEFVVLVDSGASVIQNIPLKDVIEFIEAQYGNHKQGFRPEPTFEVDCGSRDWRQYPGAYPEDEGGKFPWCVNQDGDPCFYDTDVQKWRLACQPTTESADVKYWKLLQKHRCNEGPEVV